MKQLLLLSLLGIALNSFAQTDKELVENTVDSNIVKGHIYFLADDLLMGRETGTPGNKIAASYLANMLRSYGAKPNPETNTYYQPFKLVETTAPEVEFSANDKTYPEVMPINANNLDLSGKAIYLDYGSDTELKKADLQGKIVIFKGGTSDDQAPRSVYRRGMEKAEILKEKGAAGMVEFVSIDSQTWSSIAHSFHKSVRFAEDSTAHSEFLQLWVNDSLPPKFEKGKQVDFKISATGKKEKKLATQNVVGYMEGTDPELKNEYIIYSAHYDHVGIGRPNAEGDSIYNGARDNAIGTTAVLSMAENIGNYPTKRSALFILFTGEEKGLLGSQYYVKHPIIPLEKMVYCFNTDGGGYNNTELATIIGLERTTAAKHIKNGAETFGLRAIDDPAKEQGLFDRSDNVSFAKMGIPAPTYSTGFDAFDAEIFKYYHQPSDEANSLDYQYLLKFYQGYVYSGRLIANDAETPFWVQGDKYEEAGKKLYHMPAALKD